MRSLPEGITSMRVPVATGAYILPEGIASMGVPVATGAYICTFIFVIVPSMASVFNEYALKTQYDTSIYLQNLFLYGMEQHSLSQGSLELLLSKVQKLPSSWCNGHCADRGMNNSQLIKRRRNGSTRNGEPRESKRKESDNPEKGQHFALDEATTNSDVPNAESLPGALLRSTP
ncbi:hypothetical protein L2E82_48718 [Cichorium intybus]|uniref:Uncharacterized protein n=1 Tax=Cichorium intybus TaxID=13427 RepID=A0ACB8Z052_CICIN|nr:hypothetical protein L2E82_48718 [Cichorium intybus]